MPDWAKHAYHNCPTVNRVMKECALRETTREEMQWRVAGALYEQRNQWKETALHLKQYEPLVVKMPNDQDVSAAAQDCRINQRRPRRWMTRLVSLLIPETLNDYENQEAEKERIHRLPVRPDCWR